jgi:hypothetical protein
LPPYGRVFLPKLIARGPVPQGFVTLVPVAESLHTANVNVFASKIVMNTLIVLSTAMVASF